MAGVQDLFNQYMGQPSAGVSTPAQPQQTSGTRDPYSIAAARRSGNGSGSRTQEEYDRLWLNPLEMNLKYGREAADAIYGRDSKALQAYDADRTATRSGGEAVLDTGNAALGAFVGGVFGMANLGMGLASPELGARGSKSLEEFNASMRADQSDAINARRRANAANNALSLRDNTKTFEREVETQGELIANLNRIGRDAVSTVQNLDDPMLFGDLTANGIGSLVGTKGIGKILSTAGRLATLGRATGRAAVIGRAALMPASIGLTEGAGAYSQSTAESYDALIAKGVDPTEAAERANRAGLISAAITAPTAALIGHVTGAAKLEAAPFTVRSLGSGILGLGRETVEEGLQSGAGQIAQNIGYQSQVDPSRALSEGVGEQAAMGAMGGLGMAGVLQGPGITLQAAVETAKLPIRAAIFTGKAAAGAVGNALAKVGERRMAASDARSDAIIDALGGTAAGEAPGILDEVNSGLDSMDAAPDLKSRAADYVSKVAGMVGPLAEAALDGLPPRVREAVMGSGNRVEALKALANAVKDKTLSGADRLLAHKALRDLVDQHEDLAGKTAPEIVSELSEATRQKVSDMVDAVSNLGSSETVQGALAAGSALYSKAAPKVNQRARAVFDGLSKRVAALKAGESIPEVELQEAQASADMVVGLAEVSPEKMDQKAVEEVIFHEREGRIVLTPNQKTLLNGSLALLKGNRQAMETASKKYGLSAETDRVSKEVQTSNEDADDVKKSAKGHMQGVVDAYRAGDAKLAAERLARFRSFAEHMGNKVLALNEALTTGKTNDRNSVRYKALGPKGGFRLSAKGLYVKTDSPSSVATAQRIALDAEAVAGVFNSLADALPNLNVDHIDVVPLHEGLDGPADRVVQEYRSGKRKVPTNTNTDVTEADKGQPDNQSSEPAKAEVAETVQEPETVAEPAVAPKEDTAKVESKEVITPPATVVEKVVEPVSRITEEQAAKLSDEGLQKRIEAIQDRMTLKETRPDDQATFDVLNEEMNRREDAVFKDGDPAALTGQPEVEAVVKAKPEPKGIKAAYPKLVGGAKNLFHKAFKLPKEARTRIIGTDSPMNVVADALSSSGSLKAFTGAELKRQFSDQTAEAYNSYLAYGDDLKAELDRRLQEALNAPVSKTNKKKMSEITLEGDNLSWRQGMALNLTEVNEDGSISYNQELVEAAVLAGLQWFLKLNKAGSLLDAKAVSALTGIDLDHTAELEAIATLLNGKGFGTVEAARSLAREIERFWGLSADANMPRNQIEGLYEGLAKEILESMDMLKVFDGDKKGDPKKGLLTRSFVELTEADGLAPGNKRTITRWSPASLGEDNPLKGFPTAIETAVQMVPEETNYLNEVPPAGLDHQLRNPNVKLSNQQKKTKAKVQDTPHYLDLGFVEFLKALGEDGAMAYFGGGGPTEGRVLNKNHKRSLDGQNLTAQSAYRSVMDLIAELESTAAVMGVPIDQVPIRYAYEFTVVNRLMMLGKNNPQANKIMRHAVLPTRATLDLSDPKEAEKFMMGVAQGLGIKVHNQSRATTMTEVNGLLTGSLAEALALVSGKPDTMNLMSEDAARIFREAELDPTKVYVLREYARSGLAEGKPVKGLVSSIYFEADGVANGVTNAMALFMSGLFENSWRRNIAKGGVLIGQLNKTLADHKVKDGDDLYQATGNEVSNQSTVQRRDNAKNRGVNTQLDAVRGLLDLLLPDANIVSVDGRVVLEVGRKVTKNPMTITLYGSGEKGIAGNITKELVDIIYEMMSKAAQRELDDPTLTKAQALFDGDAKSAQIKMDTFTGLLSKLTAKGLYRDPKTKLLGVFTSKAETSGRGTFDEFTFTGEDLKTIRANIQHGFVTPLRLAIDETVGNQLRLNTASMLRQSQSWSIIGAAAYKRAYDKAHAARRARDPEFKKTDMLSRAEEDAVYESVKDLIPNFRTETQGFMLGGKQALDLTDREDSEIEDVDGEYSFQFAQSLSGRLRTPAQIYVPGTAGVSVLPFLTIGAGDGQMIQNFYTELDDSIDVSRTLPIYDGIHSSVTEMDVIGRAANEAAYKAWRGNPMKALSDGFSEFLTKIPADLELTSEELHQLRRSVLEPDMWETAVGLDHIVEAMKREAEVAATAARSAEARQIVLDMVSSSTDQMAGAGAPYVHEGMIDLSELDEDNMVTALNGLYNVVLRQLDEGVADPAAAILEQAQAAEKTAELMSKPAPVQSVSDLNKMVEGLKTDRQTKSLLRDVVKSMAADGYEVIVTTADHIVAQLMELGLSRENAVSRSTASGFTVPGAKKIYVVEGNSDAETVLHELLHAATFEKVLEHFSGGKQFEAVVRIQALMAQFRKLDMSEQPFEAQEAYADAIREMDRRLASSTDSDAVRQAAELNEFMAWSLSNADLANTLKTVKVESRMVRLARAAVKAIKALLWGSERSAAVKDDIFTNLRFNTNILMRSPLTNSQYIGGAMLFQDNSASSRLMNLRRRIKARIADLVMSSEPELRDRAKSRVDGTLVQGARIANSFVTNGFPMDHTQYLTFRDLVSVMSTNMELDANATSRMQQLYAHVAKNLTVESFMEDPSNDDQRPMALDKFNTVIGKFTGKSDASGRSSVLPAFIALAMVDDGFREILKKVPMPKGNYGSWNSTDGLIDNLGEGLMDNLSRVMSGEGRKTADVQTALDNLTEAMLETAEENRVWFEKYTQTGDRILGGLNDGIVKGMKAASAAGLKAANKIQGDSSNIFRMTAAETLRLASSIISEESGALVSEGWVSLANRHGLWTPLRELLVDMVGRTESNKEIYDLIKRARAWAQQVRQQFREALPEFLNSQFTVAPTDAQQQAMFKGFGQTDLASLKSGYSMATILKMVSDPIARKAEISKLEAQIKAKPHGAKVLVKAAQLARYMNTKIQGSNLLTNADAVANLLNEGLQGPDNSPAQVKAVDHLISLYALDGLSGPTAETLSSLVQAEGKGTSFVLDYLDGQRKIELEKAKGNGRFNHYKGNIPTENGRGVSLVIVPTSQIKDYARRSYVYVKPYIGSIREADIAGERLVYMYAPINARPPFSQGIMQNVQQTVSGVDQLTGFSTEQTAGHITSPEAIKLIRGTKNENEREALVPRFDANGKVYAYERSIDPAMLEKLNRKENLTKAIGVWAGRQAEEKSAFEINKALIDSLKRMYDEAKKSGRVGEFQNLFESKDRVVRDALGIMNTPAMDYIEQVFGKGKFMVRTDLFNDSIGYRNASIGDAWTGNSRWSPETQKHVRNILVGIFGAKAYQYVLKAEEMIQGFVSDARVTIVVKSVIVPMANLAANLYQLIGRGVPLMDIVRKMPKKLAEIDGYTKSRIRLMEAEAELRATTDRIDRTRLETEIRTISDQHKRLSIWPLIQAGEFSSVSDAGSREDVLLTSGRFAEYMEQLAKKLPKGVSTAGRYAILAKDTSLFKGLQKAVEYGDFVAKAVLYDDLVNRQGKTPDYAMGRVTEEFVNYDRLPGRTRGYLESVGLLWFWNFKIRSAKVAMSMMRNNPVHAAMSMMMPSPPGLADVGLPIEDNFWAALFSGRLMNSVGWGMGMRAPGLLPIGQLIL